MSIWQNPQGETGGGGGGGTPSSVHWTDIKGKPQEFTPEKHTHIIADIKELPEELSDIKEVVSQNEENTSVIIKGLSEDILLTKQGLEDLTLIVDKKVDAVEGKGLSTNDFTDELKEELENLINTGAGEGQVFSVNGKTGKVELDAEDIGLGNVLNKEQATKEELDELKETIGNIPDNPVLTVNHVPPIDGDITINKADIGLPNVINEKQATEAEFIKLEGRVNNFDIQLEKKVDKVPGKQLSSNDFTDEMRIKLTEMQNFPENLVNTVNGETGDVLVNKDTLDLDKVTNDKQATKIEFDNYVEAHDLEVTEIKESLNKKANKVDVDAELKTKVNRSEFATELDKKVDAVEGMGLSSNDFTDEYKEKLIALDSGEGGETPSGEYVESINGKTGHVIINDETLGIDKKYATLESFDSWTSSANILHGELQEDLLKKVDKVEGKELSSNDFSDEYKAVVQDLIKEPAVKKVNGSLPDESGNVEITFEGVSNEEFTKHINDSKIHFTATEKEELLDKLLQLDLNKVDKVEGKDLSSNDFTNAHLSNIANNTANIAEHIADNEVHLSLEDRINIGRLEGFSEELDELTTSVDELNIQTEEHIQDTNAHLTDEQRETLIESQGLASRVTEHTSNKSIHMSTEDREKINTMSTQVQANEKAIKHLEELIGEDPGAVLPDGYIEELAKGHLYAFGNEVFDIINRNVIQGTMARRFALDNKDGLLSKENFRYNIIKVNGRDVFATGVDPESEENDLRYYEGLLDGVIQIEEDSFTQSVSANGEEIFNSSGIGVQLLGNTFELNIGMDDLDSETGELLKHASISMDFQLNLILPSDGFNMSTLSSFPFVTNNTFLFEDLHQHTIITKAELTYHEEFTNERVVFNNIFSNNTFVINKRAENGAQFDETIFSYVDKNAPVHTEHGIQLGLDAQTRDNYICDELLRKFDGVFDYIPERMEDPKRPIFNKATITHVLAMESDASPRVNEDGELTEKLVANTETPLEEVAVRNTVIIDKDTDISNIPDGTLVFVKAGE